MKKVYLFCSAGMSTSLLVNKMRDAAAAQNLDLEIDAHPVGSVGTMGKEADIILLGPQIRFQLKNVSAQYPDKPVEVIDMRMYGTMNGAAVIERVKELIG